MSFIKNQTSHSILLSHPDYSVLSIFVDSLTTQRILILWRTRNEPPRVYISTNKTNKNIDEQLKFPNVAQSSLDTWTHPQIIQGKNLKPLTRAWHTSKWKRKNIRNLLNGMKERRKKPPFKKKVKNTPQLLIRQVKLHFRVHVKVHNATQPQWQISTWDYSTGWIKKLTDTVWLVRANSPRAFLNIFLPRKTKNFGIFPNSFSYLLKKEPNKKTRPALNENIEKTHHGWYQLTQILMVSFPLFPRLQIRAQEWMVGEKRGKKKKKQWNCQIIMGR